MNEKLDLILSELQALNKGQKALEKRQTRLEERFVSLEERQVGLEERFTSLEERQTGLEERFTSLEERQTALESGQRELHQMIRAIRDNQLETRAGFDGMRHDLAHMKGDMTEIKAALPTFVTRDEFKQVNERLDIQTYLIGRAQERIELLEQREE